MVEEVWQRLLILESIDLAQANFAAIHGISLSVSRARQISFAARQAREFFRNAERSNFSVRPLLIFYGIEGLARALTLLMLKTGGDTNLVSGHGIKAKGWRQTLGADVPEGLRSIPNLKIELCSGLLRDLLRSTRNRTLILERRHPTRYIDYPVPIAHAEFTLNDLMCRIPDLSTSRLPGGESFLVYIRHLLSSNHLLTYEKSIPNSILSSYTNSKYDFELKEQSFLDISKSNLTGVDDTFQVCHSFSSIDSERSLYLLDPFAPQFRISEIGIFFVASYYTGMLARYFPTHWMSLIQGSEGDSIWPLVNEAQTLVQETFPRLVAEFIENASSVGNWE